MLSWKEKLLTPSKTFGKSTFFEVGDLVCWNIMGKNKSGVLERLFVKVQGGRDVAFASVFEFSDSKRYEVLCINLKKNT